MDTVPYDGTVSMTTFATATGIGAGTYTIKNLLQQLVNRSHSHTKKSISRSNNCNCKCDCDLQVFVIDYLKYMFLSGFQFQ